MVLNSYFLPKIHPTRVRTRNSQQSQTTEAPKSHIMTFVSLCCKSIELGMRVMD